MNRAVRKRLRVTIVPASFLVLLSGWAGIAFGGRLEVIWEAVKDDTLQEFGVSLASAGDVNGDGYDDIIVGAQPLDMGPNNTFTGRVYLYLGGPEMDTIPDVTFAGETILDCFGWSVTSAGDANGDGYDDVIVGAPGAVTDTSASGLPVRRGKAYVYFGGPFMDSIPDMVMRGWNQGAAFGQAISSAGDVNGDGYDDFVIGAYGTMIEHWDLIGRVYLYFGGPSVDIRPDVTLNGPRWGIQNPTNFGQGVAGAGDLNSDGYADLLIGAGGHTETYLGQGKVYIYFGGNPMDTIPDVWILGEGFAHFLGFRDRVLSGAGDVNGDGYDDALIGNPFYPYGFFGVPNPGKVLLLFGGDAMDSIPDWTKVGPYDDTALGMSVSGMGDLDMDGYQDIVAGGPSEHGTNGPMGYASSGRVYTFLGGSPMSTIENAFLAGSYEDAFMGDNVVSAGDVDGDSIDEMIVSSTINARRHYYSHVQVCKWVETALVTDLAARGGDGLVKLGWLAQYENDTRGYNVCRSGTPDTTGWVRVNRYLVTGAECYSYADTGVANGETYYYWVEVLGRRGNTDHFGPVSATPESLVLSSFSAWKGAASYVVVHWETGSEPELTGWNIYRREERDSLPGEGSRVNGDPIAQRGPLYEWSDCWGVEEDQTYFYWLSAIDLLGGERYFGPVEVNTARIRLYQNTPNPFESWTTIRCSIAYPCRVTLKVYDVSGRLVKTLVRNQLVSEMPGQLTATWDGTDDAGRRVSAGVYFYRLSAGEFSATRKLVVLR